MIISRQFNVFLVYVVCNVSADWCRVLCQVGDLGLSKVKCQTLISGGVRGTLPWMAPELLNGSSSLVSEKVNGFNFQPIIFSHDLSLSLSECRSCVF